MEIRIKDYVNYDEKWRIDAGHTAASTTACLGLGALGQKAGKCEQNEDDQHFYLLLIAEIIR
jgi:hypothetical protein